MQHCCKYDDEYYFSTYDMTHDDECTPYSNACNITYPYIPELVEVYNLREPFIRGSTVCRFFCKHIEQSPLAMNFLFCLLVFFINCLSSWSLMPSGELLYSGDCAATQDLLSVTSHAVGAVLRASPRPRSSVLLVTDGGSSAGAILEVRLMSSRPRPWRALVRWFFDAVVGAVEAPMGVGVFVVEKGMLGVNMTEVVAETRKLVLSSWNAVAVVASADRGFLAAFAEAALRCRLLQWDTRLLLVTRLTPQDVRDLMRANWAFGMTNTMLLNTEERRGKRRGSRRYSLYVHLPYGPHGPHGPHQTVRVGSWTPESGLILSPEVSVFQDKYSNFHGAKVNITALPWMPNWKETQERTADGGNVTSYSGTDYFALETVAETLNFTINMIQTEDFVEVEKQVEERIAFLCPLIYTILPERMERYDFTRYYSFIHQSFAMRTPALHSPWKSLVSPLSGAVWAAVAAAVLMNFIGGDWYPNLGDGLQQIYKTLLGQDFDQRRSNTAATRLVISCWLVFALIVGVAYRSNLMASLALGTRPHRPEDIRELVEAVDRVNTPLHGKVWKDFYSSSESSVYRALGKLLFVGPSIAEGLQLAAKEKYRSMFQAVIANRMFLDYVIAANFSNAAGEATLYTGKSSLYSSPAAWILPQGAPYRRHLDRLLTVFVENGLFTKWHRYMMEDVRKNLRRQKEELEGNDSVETEGDRALSVSHMQGPFLILCSGLGLAGIAFLVEMVLGWFSGSRFGCDSGCVYMLDPMIKRFTTEYKQEHKSTSVSGKGAQRTQLGTRRACKMGLTYIWERRICTCVQAREITVLHTCARVPTPARESKLTTDSMQMYSNEGDEDMWNVSIVMPINGLKSEKSDHIRPDIVTVLFMGM
ncbi:uncharacterized protein LOC122265928 [Penaeus japonicus]|uniref:uncharacterized protein LOC122265928 n=1 Tax=Penaeus japonicus TaxID=27405 RepID=UPI001C716851|nr:uncharacterized protein LOC122265928 [Penaeus japonicus]